ncbi:hypothetical protein ACWGWX_27500, partial [Klebsiella pneumoniae]
MKVDVIIQSFKKPELLFYTLLSLKKHSEQHIHTIWINDDSDNDSVMDFYKSEIFQKALEPWVIMTRKNTQRGGWWFTPVKGLYPSYLGKTKRIIYSIRAKIKGTGFQLLRSNSRYQWGLDSTDKKFVFIIHDDIEFYQDVLGLMINKVRSMSKPGIVGDLGQCWRCEYSSAGCTPYKVDNGILPSPAWPDIEPTMNGHRWPCRINEWCCLLSKDAADYIERKHKVLYGSYDNHGDISAYWFALLNREHYEFSDIAKNKSEKDKLFIHADGGSGHSVWVDQGDGKKKYNPDLVRALIKQKYNII